MGLLEGVISTTVLRGTWGVATAGLLVLITLLIVRLIQNCLRLPHIPGPFWSQFSDLWIAFKLRRGDGWRDITRSLAEEYGDVVRFSPTNVLFSNPDAIPTIYGTQGVWKKALSYQPPTTVIDGRLQGSFTTTRDEKLVTSIKNQVNAAFTPRSIGQYEEHVTETCRLLINRVRENGPKVDIFRWLELFAFESICRIAFSDGAFTEDDLQETLKGITQRFVYWNNWFALPKLEKLLFKNPLVRYQVTPSLLAQRSTRRIDERRAKAGAEEHRDLLEHFLKANREAPQIIDRATMVGLVISVIHAGGETTAITITNTLRYLLLNPLTMSAFVEELDQANLTSPPSFEATSKLQYLDAALKETMRLRPITIAPMEREVPAGGATIDGVFIPEFTSVAVNLSGLAMKEEVWGPEPGECRPQRWLEASEPQRKKMERVFHGFGYGKRMCLGQHVAWIEMKKIIPDILLNYELTLIDPEKPMKYTQTILESLAPVWVEAKPRNRK